MASNLWGDLLGAAADLKLWACLLAGPLAWTIQMAVSYPLAQIACSGDVANQPPVALHAVSAGALAAVCAGALMSWRLHNNGGHERYRFMTLLSLFMCALFGLVVLATWVPPLLMRCEA